MSAPRLTKRRLEAMANALAAIIAGGCDPDGDAGDILEEDYEAAADWVAHQLNKRADQ